jgi:hypothetical protein
MSTLDMSQEELNEWKEIGFDVVNIGKFDYEKALEEIAYEDFYPLEVNDSNDDVMEIGEFINRADNHGLLAECIYTLLTNTSNSDSICARLNEALYEWDI